MRTITLNPKQQRTAEILTRLEAGAVDVGTAAELLGVSERQVRRLRARFRLEGLASSIHGNSGRTPSNRLEAALREQILTLAGNGGKYHDLNVCHLQELLVQEEQISIGRSTLDRLLKQAGLRQKAKNSPPLHRRRRQRRAAEGMLLQIDGSPFESLEGRGPKAALIGAIDDASGKVLFLHFRPTEDQIGYLLLLRTVAQNYGLPMSLYHDRHTILRSPKRPTPEEELAGQAPMSQIQRIMAELGIESIAAYSPQAKGRIERLWGTLQDRLTKELRLTGATSLDEANDFLPGFIARYNARFAKAPQDPHSAWVPMPADVDINYYFAIRETRKVRSDHCISYGGQLLQLLPDPKHPSLVNQRVSVHSVPEGAMYLYHGKHLLPWRRVTPSEVAPLPAPDSPLPPKAVDAKKAGRRRGWLYAQR